MAFLPKLFREVMNFFANNMKFIIKYLQIDNEMLIKFRDFVKLKNLFKINVYKLFFYCKSKYLCRKKFPKI